MAQRTAYRARTRVGGTAALLSVAGAPRVTAAGVAVDLICWPVVLFATEVRRAVVRATVVLDRDVAG